MDICKRYILIFFKDEILKNRMYIVYGNTGAQIPDQYHVIIQTIPVQTQTGSQP